jgi:hypothetical protein
MDDGLVLNLATDNFASSAKVIQGKKGGRWTDRYVFSLYFLEEYPCQVSGQRQKELPNEKVDQGRRQHLRFLMTKILNLVLRKGLVKSHLILTPLYLCKPRPMFPIIHKVHDRKHK